MKRSTPTPHAPSSTGEDPSLLSKAPRELSVATSKDDRVGHYMAKWALPCPLERRQFNVAFKDLYVGTSSRHTGEAMKRAVECTPRHPPPPPPMCDLVLVLRCPKHRRATATGHTPTA